MAPKTKNPGSSQMLVKSRIDTVYDQVLKLLQEKKKLSGRQVKKALNIDSRALNDSIDVLEERGLIEVSYSPLGGASLKLVEPELALTEEKKDRPGKKRPGGPGLNLFDRLKGRAKAKPSPKKGKTKKSKPAKKIKLKKPLVKEEKSQIDLGGGLLNKLSSLKLPVKWPSAGKRAGRKGQGSSGAEEIASELLAHERERKKRK